MGQPLRIAPFQTDHRVRAVGRDIYDAAPVTREVLVLASSLVQGDSGAPLVTAGGVVVGVAFAIAPDQDGVAYALPTASVDEVLGRPRARTSTGRCAG
jgi:S1-C subfamily serine protease